MGSQSRFYSLPEEEQAQLLTFEQIRETEEAEAVALSAGLKVGR